MSASLNRAMIIGNITKDIELKNLESGNSVASFSVATNREWKDSAGNKQEQAEFHNVVAWGKLAEICAKFLKKGSKVYIDGRLQTREWEAKDGSKRRQTEIVAENMVMLSKKDNSGTVRHDDLGGIESVDNPNNDISLDNFPI